MKKKCYLRQEKLTIQDIEESKLQRERAGMITICRILYESFKPVTQEQKNKASDV